MEQRKFQQLCEQFGMMTTQKRLFYPRNFNLSPGFIKALKAEMAQQDKAGIEPAAFSKKLQKALHFYVTDFNKMKKMKKARSAEQDSNSLEQGGNVNAKPQIKAPVPHSKKPI